MCVSWGGRELSLRYVIIVLFFIGVGDFGGGGRVRTRNTLHIVGARKSSICYDAVEGRKDEIIKEEKNRILL